METRIFALFFDFFCLTRKKSQKSRIFGVELVEKQLELGEIRIAMTLTTHLFGVPFVLLDHLFGLFCLMFVMGRLGLFDVLLRPFFHLLHLPLGLTHGTRPVGGTRGEDQDERQ